MQDRVASPPQTAKPHPSKTSPNQQNNPIRITRIPSSTKSMLALQPTFPPFAIAQRLQTHPACITNSHSSPPPHHFPSS
ncbi:hypothetical protein M440DRAFT_1402076 [Trichoderma longibrachiatum ATCC 18648]|uniref:Uncharacterized protein n=1 Tax=Trichoderma longibrachiatum ATCC 18648 TaxID=983965 RepID=A0A2T4C1W3_TRILO|nr:hypothetical protein M440DRAFT_1402076 [Trichoderma longibrachiatum ATCC 18648]